ncbi:MAG: LLM class flavin-dependent oxidoreductase, partial [Gammaproteobacteria bacterium]|nr:LLM class flavin-dependent oxidoreductase [Gammaproteobacteria bacterium]
ICEALELFAAEVMPEFKEREAERERRKMEELAPYLEAAMERKIAMQQLKDDDIPVFESLGRKVSQESQNEESIYEKPQAAG